MNAGENENTFTISWAEMERRRVAFDRMAISTTVAATLFGAGLIIDYFPLSLLGILLVALVFLASRSALGPYLVRFAATTWALSDSALSRADDRSSERYPLASITRIRTTMTTRGDIREMKLVLDGGRVVHVNGLEDFAGFREALELRALGATRQEAREPVDYDHPAFYVVFGAAVGLAIVAGLTALVSSGLKAAYVYFGLALYCFVLAAYWWLSHPLAGRYGERGARSDRLFVAGIVGVGLVAGLIGFLS